MVTGISFRAMFKGVNAELIHPLAGFVSFLYSPKSVAF